MLEPAVNGTFYLFIAYQGSCSLNVQVGGAEASATLTLEGAYAGVVAMVAAVSKRLQMLAELCFETTSCPPHCFLI